MRTEACVCGGVIRARSMSVAAVAVQQHNMSLTHCVWRLGREAPTATLTVSDVSSMVRRASAPPVRRIG